MKFNHKETYEKLHLYSGIPIEDIRATFDSMGLYLIMCFLEDRKAFIPYIGNVSIKHEGDSCIDGAKKAIVNFEIEADDDLVRNIGQAFDGDEMDIQKKLNNTIFDSLNSIVNS